jgi:peptidoglycan/LPS O-acetylase OafA/YrhL
VSPVFLHVPFVGYANGVLWTVPMEFKCYLLVAAMGVAKLLRRRWAVAALFAGAFVFYAIQLPRLPTHGDINQWPRFLTYFSAGMIFHCYRSQIPRTRAIAIVSAVLILATSLAGRGMELMMPICGTYLLFSAGFGKKVRVPGLGDRIDLSYGVYLYAYPLQQLIMNAIRHPIAPMLLFAIVLPPLFMCAAFSWYCVERPFLKKPNREIGKRRIILPATATAFPEPPVIASRFRDSSPLSISPVPASP